MDNLTRERRARLMSRVRSKNTEPEMSVRRIAHSMGFRFRVHRRDLPGRPDIVFPKYRAVVFVHGCFWHRHPGCMKATIPKSNMQFWIEKFERNMQRDSRQTQRLRDAGWKVVVVWECQVAELEEVRGALRGITQTCNVKTDIPSESRR